MQLKMVSSSNVTLSFLVIINTPNVQFPSRPVCGLGSKKKLEPLSVSVSLYVQT